MWMSNTDRNMNRAIEISARLRMLGASATVEIKFGDIHIATDASDNMIANVANKF